MPSIGRGPAARKPGRRGAAFRRPSRRDVPSGTLRIPGGSMSEEAFQAVRAAGFAAALALALLLEWRRPHAALRPAWGTNLGLWLTGVLVIGIVCGACGFATAQWASARGLGVLGALRAPAWLAALFGFV